jgi:zinc protease
MKQRSAPLFLYALLAGALLPGRLYADDPKLSFERYTLENGLEVILHQDRRVPIVAVDVWYHVGSGDEVLGKSGFAHLFEHLMFEGSAHVPEGEFDKILQDVGVSSTNGSTTTERTNYYEVIPSNQLEVALWLESDRMGYLLPALKQETLDNQREIVRNERRQNYENRPYAKEGFVLNEALYPEGHPYRYLTIGRHEDLAAASLEDVKGFFKRWYVPSNATLVIAGDFDTAEAKKLVEKWFGNFPKTAKPAHKTTTTPAITATKRVPVTDEYATLRRVHYAWVTPVLYAPGDAELDIIATALGREGTGRLHKILVLEKQLAQSVAVFQQSDQRSSVFHLTVNLKPEADLAAVEEIINTELERVMKEPLSASDLERVVVQSESSLIWGLEDLLSRAEALHSYNHHTGNPDYITQDLDRYRKATPEGVRAAAAKYLKKDQRVEVITTPAAKGGK